MVDTKIYPSFESCPVGAWYFRYPNEPHDLSFRSSDDVQWHNCWTAREEVAENIHELLRLAALKKLEGE